MNRYPIALVLGLVSIVVAPNCFTTEADSSLEDVFACTIDDDCPEDMVCGSRACVSPENLISVTITNPEPDQIFALADMAGTEFTVRFNSDIKLVEPGSPNELGAGYLVLTVDGQSLRYPRDASQVGVSGITVLETFELDPTPGAHRLELRAFRPNGEPYVNDDAIFRSVVWFEEEPINGQPVPYVALIDPWPGDELPTRSTSITGRMHTLNFEVEGIGQANRDVAIGHGHIHYEVVFPMCVDDTICDNGYFDFIDIDPTVIDNNVWSARGRSGSIPEAEEGMATLTVVLRRPQHDVFLFEEDTEEERIIFDTIPIVRTSSANR